MQINNMLYLQGVAKKRNIWWVFVYSLVVLCCFYPYEFYTMYLPFLPDEIQYSLLAFWGSTSLLILLSGKKLKWLGSELSLAFIMQSIGYYLSMVYHGRTALAIAGLFLTMGLPILLLIYINCTIGLVEFFKKYNRWILLMAVLGTIAFVLVVFMGFKPAYFIFDRADERPIFNYIITFTKSDPMVGESMRYAGFFDEPGAMAYWGVYALVINQLFVKDNKLEIALIVCLLFTFSLGFYAQIIAYILFFHVRTKNLKNSLLVIFLFVIIGFFFYSSKGTSSDIYEQTIGRIENAISQSSYTGNILDVDSREGLIDVAKTEFLNNPWLGTSRTDLKIDNNVYETLAQHGVIGSFFILFPYLLLLILGFRDRDLLKCTIVMILGFTHRPFSPKLLYFFIIYSIIVMYVQKKKISKMSSILNLQSK